MTYTQAKMIANSPYCYTPEQWKKAASVLLGRLNTSDEEFDEAADLCRRFQNAKSQVEHFPG